MSEPASVQGSQHRPHPYRTWLLKGAVSAGVLVVVFSWVPVEEAWTALRSIPLWLWSAVVGVFLCGHLLAAAKWWRLAVRPAGIPLGVAVRAHFAGLVANLCLPGVAGGDVVRAGVVLRRTRQKTLLAVGSLADRVLDCLALLILAAAGALLMAGGADALRGVVWQMAALVTAGIGGAVAGLYVLRRMRLPGLLGRASAAAGELARRPLDLVVCLATSVLIQAVFVGLNVLLATAAGLTAPVAAWYCAWPLAKLISIAPVSLGGLGVREASLAALMATFGVAAAGVVAVGLVWQTVLIAGGLIGASLSWLSDRRSGAADLGLEARMAERR